MSLPQLPARRRRPPGDARATNPTRPPSPLDDDVVLVTLLACLSHDVGHPGLTNNYLVETGHELAIRYNDASPLENMHAAVALNLAKPYLRTRPAPDQKQNRALWIGLLLATDMKEHSQQIFELERALAKAKERGTSYEACTPEHHVPCLKIFIHCCDISNPAKPWPVYCAGWARHGGVLAAGRAGERAGAALDGATRDATDLAKFQTGSSRSSGPCSPPPPHRRRTSSPQASRRHGLTVAVAAR